LCSSCVLYREPYGSPTGFVPKLGPTSSRILFLGEAAGEDEVYLSEPFRGRAGSLLNRVFRMNSITRESHLIMNTLWCRPPNNILDGAVYESEAITTCRTRHWQPALDRWLADTPPGAKDKVVVTLGGIPLRWLLDYPSGSGVRVQDFHGTVNRDPSDRFWVVPTFHPSHISRGAFNLIGTSSWDLQHAFEIAQHGFEREELDLVLDPPIEWFEEWVDSYLSADMDETWLAVDVETPDKERQTDEGEIKSREAKSWHIIRVNFACHPDQGITVPHSGPYVPLITKVLASRGVKLFHNGPYDIPRLRHAGHEVRGPVFDSMWMWKRYQSDLPRGLGFISPFVSPRLEPWKHRAHTDPVWYAANDGPRTLRIGFWIADKLQRLGLWETPYYRHVYLLDKRAFWPAEEVGININEERLKEFTASLEEKHKRINTEIQAIVPEELMTAWATRNADGGLKKRPLLDDGSPEPDVLERVVTTLVQVCETCGAEQISKTHRCEDRGLTARVVMAEREVQRFYRRESFNPGSPPQVLAYIRFRGHVPKKDKKSKKDSSNKDTITHLIKTTRDPLYPRLREIRIIDKVWRTYAVGTQKRLAEDPRSQQDHRLHCTTTHAPSTARTSQTPNFQNVVADRAIITEAGKKEEKNPAAGFRLCVEASPGCLLVEADYNAMEPTEVGWYIGDPNYIRLSKLSIHAFVTSVAIGRPADLKWSDPDLKAYFEEIKTNQEATYKQVKCAVNGNNNGLTVRGMVLQYPDVFPTEKIAQRVQDIYYSVVPGLPKWHAQIREHAARYRILGGKIDNARYNPLPGFHPYGYRHYFYNVLEYRPVKGMTRASQIVKIAGKNFKVGLGEDGKRCVAFFQQSVAAGVIKEAMLELFDPDHPNFIGEEFYGKTPLRALIHDSLLLEVPTARVEVVIEKLRSAMTRPIEEQPCPPEWGLGSHLQMGVDVKVGRNWAVFDSHANLEGMTKHFDLAKLTEPRLADFDRAAQGETGLREDFIPIDEYDEDLDELLDEIEFDQLKAV
jgi:uracil-DNA glycosylase family 4